LFRAGLPVFAAGVLALAATTLHAAETGAAPPPGGTVSLQQISPAGDGSLDLGALKGHVVYLDFWASWCGPCKLSFPWMMEMQRRYGPQGLVVVAVNLDRDRALAATFLREFNPAFAIVFDGKATLAQQFKVAGMPSSVIIDREGKARSTHTGFRPDERPALEAELRTALQ
jgi:thiol-disulfide isomerase/thioredoxin